MASEIFYHTHFLISPQESGADFLSSLYGQYLKLDAPDVNPKLTSIGMSNSAHHFGWQPVISTNLNISNLAPPTQWHVERFQREDISPEYYFLVKRDYKDVLVQRFLDNRAEHKMENIQDFLISPEGLPFIGHFETILKDLPVISNVIHYEDLVENPQRVLAEFIHKMKLRPEYYVDLDRLDVVIDRAGFNELKEDSQSNNTSKVGIWKEWLTPEQAVYIDSTVELITA